MATVISNVKGKHNGGPDYHYTLAMTSERTSATSVKISSTLTVWLSEASDGSTYDGTDRLHCQVSAGTSTSSMKNSSDTTIRASGTTWRANNKTVDYGTLVNSDHKKTIKISEFSVGGLTKTTTSLKTHLKVVKDNGENGEYSGYGSNLTISAWPSYTITFNANGGTGAPSSQTKWKNEDLKLSSTKPTRTGYTFVNWYNSSRDVHYNPGGTVEYNGAQTLKAQWKINTYKITFNANGGTGGPTSATKTYGTTLTLPTSKPTKTGYTFLGWGTTSTATSATYSAGGSYTKNEGDTLYALWKKTITITYNANGGSGAPSSASATVYNSTTSYNFTISSTKPTRTGYTFLGWSTSSSATSATYAPGDVKSFSSSTTLYAVWKINTYTITFNANGGTYGTASATKTYGVTLTLPSTVPTRQYFTFLGWSTSKTATTATYKAGGAYTTNAAATLYAIWKENNVTVSLKRFTSKTNYSTFEKVIHIGEETTILVDNIANTYEFLGWSKEAIPQPLPYSTTRTFDKYVSVESETSNKNWYGMYRDITPTLFKLKSAEIIRAATSSQTENTFKDYYKNPEAFKGEDEYGKRLLGYFELTGEKISKIDTKSIEFLLSPYIYIDKTKIQTYFSDINNRLFFDLPADIDSSTKYTLKINFNDDLGKPVVFTVVSPFKQKIVDIYKSDGSVPAFRWV